MSKELQAKVLEADKVNFPELYEEALSLMVQEDIDGTCACTQSEKTLKNFWQALKDKRALGYQKYGESSFQGSFDNAMNTDVFAHASEEFYDIFNYLFHMKYQLLIQGKESKAKTLTSLIRNLYAFYISYFINFRTEED